MTKARAFGWVAAFGGALAVRATQVHVGLIYPDGYQYLLMARGIAEHGHPVTRLGPAGDLFVPSVDAASKPLFPLLVALLHLLGVSLRGGAVAIAAAAAAAVPVLCAAVVKRVTRSDAGAAVAYGICLASPAAAYWWGFAGPDALASALALGAAVALLSGRPTLAGFLAGATMTTRPEFALVALAAGLAGMIKRSTRDAAIRCSIAALLTVAVVIVAVRPPLGMPPFELVAAGVVAAPVVATLFALDDRTWVRGGAIVFLCAVLSLSPGAQAWLRTDWPLVLVGVLGLAAARHDRWAGILAVTAATLAAVYHLKNPNLDRYLVQLVPLAAVAAGLGIAYLARTRTAALVPAVAAIASLVLLPAHLGSRDDAFAALAPKLTDDPRLPLVTAAPDAYGFLLPHRSVRALRPGASGLVLLDGAQRLYAPWLTARGRLVATFDQAAFARSDGSIDRRDLALVRGVVIERRR